MFLAEWTGLEPATPGVTGRYSNRLNYHSASVRRLLLRAKCLPNLPPDRFGRPGVASFTEVKPGDPTGIRTPVLTVKG